jgi:hypothetical protein
MKKIFLILLFILFSSSAFAGGESIQTSGPKPQWASQLTVEDNPEVVSFVGIKSDVANLEQGINEARENAIHQFLQYLSFDVSSRYRRTRHNENQYSYEVILGKTYPVSVANLKESAVYWEKASSGRYQVYLLLPVVSIVVPPASVQYVPLPAYSFVPIRATPVLFRTVSPGTCSTLSIFARCISYPYCGIRWYTCAEAVPHTNKISIVNILFMLWVCRSQ